MKLPPLLVCVLSISFGAALSGSAFGQGDVRTLPPVAPAAGEALCVTYTSAAQALGQEPVFVGAADDAAQDYDTAITTIACEKCCADECCTDGCCDMGCCPPCVPTYWVAGVEATFLAPDMNAGTVSYRLQDEFSSPQLDATFGSDDAAVNDFYIAPRMWLGVQHGCHGVAVRYWHLQAAEAAFDPFTFTPPGPTLDYGYFIHNRLDAYTIDLEGTRSFCVYDTKNTFTFGVRYALLQHDTALSVDAQVDNGASGTGVISGNARANRLAAGTGITSSLSGRKPLFCDSCIHLFYGARGSVVWGSISNSVETDTIEVTAGATAGSYNGAVAEVDDAMFIGEVQLGLEFDYRVVCFPADAFFRVALEYQYWNADSGSAVASSFAGFGGPSPTPLSQGQAYAQANGATLDLIGLSVGTGFTW
ncbi:hypothetical protein KOR34_47930 [Posidoniimonas corsicana]|uniref:Uncharacterized protein n=1 Tax=Posidoniimonas corsicana TaxID=1938618 RepID=A0A5C5UXS0_9BACT|nr:hypothetical protein [Posidoniimonas corsicana]TWT30235.1 hypothetical protein KOR34_47930 [Posidoniimonas corsicana]